MINVIHKHLDSISIILSSLGSTQASWFNLQEMVLVCIAAVAVAPRPLDCFAVPLLQCGPGGVTIVFSTRCMSFLRRDSGCALFVSTFYRTHEALNPARERAGRNVRVKQYSHFFARWRVLLQHRTRTTECLVYCLPWLTGVKLTVCLEQRPCYFLYTENVFNSCFLRLWGGRRGVCGETPAFSYWSLVVSAVLGLMLDVI